MNVNPTGMATTNVAARLSPAQTRTVERIRVNLQRLRDLVDVEGRRIYLELEKDRQAIQGTLDAALVLGDVREIRAGQLVRPIAPEDCVPRGRHFFKEHMLNVVHSFKD